MALGDNNGCCFMARTYCMGSLSGPSQRWEVISRYVPVTCESVCVYECVCVCVCVWVFQFKLIDGYLLQNYLGWVGVGSR